MTERRDSRCQDQPGRTPAFIISERSKPSPQADISCAASQANLCHHIPEAHPEFRGANPPPFPLERSEIMTERRDSRCQDQPGRTPAFIISERS